MFQHAPMALSCLRIRGTTTNLCRTAVQVAPGKLSTGPSPLEGAYEPNTLLRHASRILEGKVEGSETVAFDSEGNMILLDKFGYLKTATRASNGTFELSGHDVYLGAGRPLGGHMLPSGDLVVCDSVKVNTTVPLALTCRTCQTIATDMMRSSDDEREPCLLLTGPDQCQHFISPHRDTFKCSLSGLRSCP